jgi:hypothetical protein
LAPEAITNPRTKRVGAPADLIQDRIVGSVEEVLHQSSHGSQVLGSAKNVTVCLKEICGLSNRRREQADVNGWLYSRSTGSSLNHLTGASGHGMIHDQERFHRA